MRRDHPLSWALTMACCLAAPALAGQQLTIHVINVGWGSAVLLEGPTGKAVLLEAGRPTMGAEKVVPYLKAKGIQNLDAMVLGHMHLDHGGGLPEVNAAGFQAPLNYWNGSPGGNSLCRAWVAAVGAVPMATGEVLDLGGGATATCIASNGRIIGLPGRFDQGDENDHSIALLVAFGQFRYLWESDLGGGPDEEDTCSHRTSRQADLEVPMIRAISPGGAHPLLGDQGLDVLHLGHHGSESSTHPLLVRLAAPTVALLSTGTGQTGDWALPYRRTIDGVLLSGREGCAGVAPPLLLQTEDGDQNAGDQRSTSGFAVGNITVRTDGSSFWVGSNSANGDQPYIAEGTLRAERKGAGLARGKERRFPCKPALPMPHGVIIGAPPSGIHPRSPSCRYLGL